MRISFKTAGLLVKYLPPGSKDRTAALEVASGATPRDVIKKLGMPEDGSYLVIHNGSSVPKAERATLALAEDDSLAIMPPLKGG
jgi:sulfur carrier protein ThiS